GSSLWNNINSSVTTDSSGIYHVILTDVNVSDSVQYYLGVEVGSDGEMTPRINLTSSMYALRANVSDSLNVSNNYTIGHKLSFIFGEMIDNLVSGWLRVTGGLNVTGDFAVNNSVFYVNATSGNVGIGTTGPTAKINVEETTAGIPLMAKFINRQAVAADVGASVLFAAGTAGNGLGQISSAFSGSATTDGAYMNFRTRIPTSGALVERMRITSDGNVGIGTTSPNGKLNVNGTGVLFNVTNATGGDIMVVDGTSGDVIFDI
ncbi:MAG: hypothetical protein ABIG69_15760, partial [Bacteroidota bacterium]